ncbi:MAG: aldo/keto reductase [Cytophagales bacterium]|nr:aldo/keto reductase [Cytophagales bacterium]
MIDRRSFIKSGALIVAGPTLSFGLKSRENRIHRSPEWRNKQSDMAYRQLGNTGLMISEFVCGGDPVSTNNFRMVEYAIEKGLNYLDMAPAYGRGECEKGYAKVVNSSSKREQVFMTTKVSGFTGVRNRLYREIFDGLPEGKKEYYRNRALELRKERGVDVPGYYLTYWPGQERSMDPSYLSNAMVADYAHKVDGSKQFKKFIWDSIKGSLDRTGQSYFDILMCPHGANCPEEVEIPEIFETLEALKKEGLVRFLGVSTHNDPAGVLRAATNTGKYDVVMCAYNVINGGYLEDAIRNAKNAGIGVIGMKVAMAVATHHKKLQPIPNWRIEKVNRIVPGNMKPPMKAYLWALQNPNISAVISNLWDERYVDDNLGLAGEKVEFQPG